ncbi:hypothetical protein XENTR_v10010508, partial [Xenopus tropicalis]
IVTVGVLGYQSDPISLSLYTNPERIPSANVTVRNNKSTNFLEVLWVPPPGNVELYVVSLISTDTSYAAQWNQSKSDPPVVFRGLLPGREFNVTIQTVSGNLSNTSLPITQATYPSAPGPWISYSSTTTSISLNWTQPQNMTGAQYSFNVTYSILPGTVYSLNPGNQSSVQIPNLQSGTNYSIRIVTVGVLGYQSDPISISLYTNPERIPSANVTVINNKSTNFLEVLWVPPPGNVELYVVSLISTDSSYAAQWNQSKSAPPVVFRGLLPGREFNVTIQTVSGNLSNTSLPITQATYPSAPGPWISYSSTTTSISLNWTQPQNMTGAQYSFNVTYSMSPITVYSLYPGNQSSVQIPNLQSGTNYSIQIVTVGVLGYQSDPISISLYTNPSAPGPWISYSSTTTSISLNWTQPQNMTGAQYSFNVTYSILPGTVYSLNPVIQSSVQIPNLQSGTNYSIQIVTVGVLGYQSDPISISLYTNPERIPSANVTVRNNKSTNFLEVLWVPPPGKVELYVISLISTDTSYAAQWNQSKSDPPVVFRGLLPGREFNVTIQTVSGNLSNTSLPITQATYPSAPGPWISNSSTTTSISLNWTQPQNMTGAQYSFNVTYSILPGTVYSLNPGNQSSVQIPNLQSGTNYSIQIVTVGVLGYQSDPISISLYTSPIVGAVVGSILGATVIAILAFFIWRRRRSQPIPKSGFEAHFRKQQANTNLGFSEEYEKFSSVGISQPKEASELPENKAKNRYNNVLPCESAPLTCTPYPYDHSRVKLSAPNHQTEDYINANYMPGYMTSREFIAAQGPLPNTVTDFWRMIWEKNISAAVMLTRCVELGKVKCEQYWPSSGQKEFGDISVSLIEESVQPEWVIRDFTVTHKRENRSKHVRHFHFTAWPDHGVPKTTDVLIGFRNLLWDYVKLSPPNSPVLVHCSAGVGRTGTLIALDRIMKQIDKEDAVDVFGTVHSLRVHRVLMVQTENQYIFLNQCALDAIRAQRANQPDLIYQNSSAIYENVSRSLRL